jgi:hypothetical protein
MGRLLAGLMFAVTASAADWSSLDRYQRTIARSDFEWLLTNVYDRTRSLTGQLEFTSNSVVVAGYPLWFGTNAPAILPIRTIGLDPGHIGGAWARMEERFFVRGKDRPVQEAALNLTVARLLKPMLEQAGFTDVDERLFRAGNEVAARGFPVTSGARDTGQCGRGQPGGCGAETAGVVVLPDGGDCRAGAVGE